MGLRFSMGQGLGMRMSFSMGYAHDQSMGL